MDAELWFRDWSVMYDGFPDDYLVIDIETTGSEEKDLIVQLGWCKIKNRQVVDNSGLLLDWSRSPIVDPSWIKRRMDNTSREMAKSGDSFPIEFSDLKQGVNPVHALSTFLEMLAEVRLNDGIFVAHNGVCFDMPMITNHFKRFLNIYYRFRPEEIWDTGALEKASQADELLCYGELPGDFAFRVIESPNYKNISWSLHRHSVPKYDLLNRFNLQTNLMHTAPFDAYLTHLLFEEHRTLANLGLERDPL